MQNIQNMKNIKMRIINKMKKNYIQHKNGIRWRIEKLISNFTSDYIITLLNYNSKVIWIIWGNMILCLTIQKRVILKMARFQRERSNKM
jgi:hypothetical protein